MDPHTWAGYRPLMTQMQTQPAALRAARVAAVAVFLTTGTVTAAWSTRIPAIADRLGLTTGALALAIVGLEFGAIVGLPLGGVLTGRYGSRRALRLGFATYPTALLAVAGAGDLLRLALAVAVMGAANSVVDVAMNVQGVELERRYGRPVLSSLHAGQSAGLLVGGVLGSVAAAAALPPLPHFAVAAGAAVLAGLSATRYLIDEVDEADEAGEVNVGEVDDGAPRPRSGWFAILRNPQVGLLGVLAFCAFLLDNAAYSWCALHVRTAYAVPDGVAASAFTVVTAALGLGRLASDRLIGRWGRVATVRAGAVTAAGGIALAVLAPTAAVSIVGWGGFGLGLASLAPAVLGATPGVAGVPAASAIAAVTMIGYLGSFSGPPAIGALAGVTGLAAALGVLAAVALAVVPLAGRALRC